MLKYITISQIDDNHKIEIKIPKTNNDKLDSRKEKLLSILLTELRGDINAIKSNNDFVHDMLVKLHTRYLDDFMDYMGDKYGRME